MRVCKWLLSPIGSGSAAVTARFSACNCRIILQHLQCLLDEYSALTVARGETTYMA
jgi:hypothetical protein